MPSAAPRTAPVLAGAPTLSTEEFALFQRLMLEEAGVHLSAAKRALVSGRLTKRLKQRGCSSFRVYYELLARDPDEHQLAVDLLTTNETYFFREPKHFDFLREQVLPAHRGSFRAWSAACSSGEEVYSIAMQLAAGLGEGDWRVLGSDLNTQVLERCRAAHYPLLRSERIPPDYLRRYCLKGTGSQDGTLLIDRALRARTEFRQINLNAKLPGIGPFDVVFLRNVMIYFSLEIKRAVVARVLEKLKPGGYFFIGHSESLNGVTSELSLVRPAIYRKPS